MYKYPPHIFVLALIVSDKCNFQCFYLQKVDEAHQGVQFSQLHHSIANVKIYKCLPHIFMQQIQI